MKNNKAILLLGSNIEPVKNMQQALALIAQYVTLVAQSHFWETEAVGSNGPNFLNIALKITTELDQTQLKTDVIQTIEDQLGRVRSHDKYAPRTMDIDIIVFNDKILDENLWSKAFIALPVAELMPDLYYPQEGSSLSIIAEILESTAFAKRLEA